MSKYLMMPGNNFPPSKMGETLFKYVIVGTFFVTMQSQSVSSQFVIWGHLIHTAVVAANICHGYLCVHCVFTETGAHYGNEDAAPARSLTRLGNQFILEVSPPVVSFDLFIFLLNFYNSFLVFSCPAPHSLIQKSNLHSPLD